jgi:hypothetical protein
VLRNYQCIKVRVLTSLLIDRMSVIRASLVQGDFMSSSNTTSKIGAVLYVIWACLHLLAAKSVYLLGRSLDSSMVQGRVFQDAWNLLFFSIIAISVAATLNWRNSVWGYWINLATVGIADTGFIFFVLVPGYTPVWPSRTVHARGTDT